jgi:hypothetical protein
MRRDLPGVHKRIQPRDTSSPTAGKTPESSCIRGKESEASHQDGCQSDVLHDANERAASTGSTIEKKKRMNRPQGYSFKCTTRQELRINRLDVKKERQSECCCRMLSNMSVEGPTWARVVFQKPGQQAQVPHAAERRFQVSNHSSFKRYNLGRSMGMLLPGKEWSLACCPFIP